MFVFVFVFVFVSVMSNLSKLIMIDCTCTFVKLSYMDHLCKLYALSALLDST